MIFTNSDDVENLEDIIKALPDFMIHVAAVTEMSNKLLALDRYENVRLYPNVRQKRIDELFEQCDFLLDINRGKEILGAGERGFLHNHLILTFKDVMHNDRVVAESLRFKAGDYESLTETLKKAAEDEGIRKDLIRQQHEQAMSETKESYTEFLKI